MGARHDTGTIEDAIHYHKWITCVACDDKFRIVFQVNVAAAWMNGLQTCPNWNCSAYRKVTDGVMEPCEKCSDGELDMNVLTVVP
jgi:hypothetical protein